MRKKSSPIKLRAGRLEFIKLNADQHDIRDAYHWMLKLSWPQFAAVVFGVYLAVNLVFSLVYYVGRPCIDGATSFSDAFLIGQRL